jgi:hypothetical protein
VPLKLVLLNSESICLGVSTPPFSQTGLPAVFPPGVLPLSASLLVVVYTCSRPRTVGPSRPLQKPWGMGRWIGRPIFIWVSRSLFVHPPPLSFDRVTQSSVSSLASPLLLLLLPGAVTRTNADIISNHHLVPVSCCGHHFLSVLCKSARCF